MLKLSRRAMRHFVTLIETHVHLIRVNPGHICKIWIFFGSTRDCKYIESHKEMNHKASGLRRTVLCKSNANDNRRISRISRYIGDI